MSYSYHAQHAFATYTCTIEQVHLLVLSTISTRARHRLSDTYYSRTPLQQKLKDFRIIQWYHRVGQHERYLHTNFEADRTNHVGTMTK